MIFRAQLRKAFDDINAGRYDKIVARFRPKHEHTFFGTHPLAGSRTSMPSTKLWYDRLARLFPDLRFEIGEIVSSGFPWNTVAAVEWRDHFKVDGVPQSNQGVHMFRFKWGRCVSLRVYCDTQKLASICENKAAHGLEEALAAPIIDRNGK